MPGIVRSSSPTLVMPDSLSVNFQEIHQFTSYINQYADGSASRLTLGDTPRKKFVLAKSLRVVRRGLETQSPFEELRALIAETNYGMDAFYFYNYREGVFDASGTSTLGRYVVVFRGAWTEAISLGERSAANLTLEEVE